VFEVRCGYLNENDLHEVPDNPGFKKLECRKGHDLVKSFGNPYADRGGNHFPGCDICKVHNIDSIGHIWRCDKCEYDLCKMCADTMFEIGNVFTFLPLNDMYRDSYSILKKGEVESRFLGKNYSKSLPKRSRLCAQCGKDHSEEHFCGPVIELMGLCKKDFSHWSCCFCTDSTSQKCKNSHDHTGLWHAKHVQGKGCGGTKCNCGNCGNGCLFVDKNLGHWGCCGYFNFFFEIFIAFSFFSVV
jgi:ribosomal protein L37AE/L43A